MLAYAQAGWAGIESSRRVIELEHQREDEFSGSTLTSGVSMASRCWGQMLTGTLALVQAWHPAWRTQAT
jgi:hypothetical protein